MTAFQPTSRALQRRTALTLAATVACALAAPAALAQGEAWPNKPIRLIVPSAAGGAADFVGRTFGRFLEQQIKQPVVIEDKPGAGGIIGTEAVKSSAPDGYTYLIAGSSTQSANVSLYAKLSYDPQKDFDEVAIFGKFPNIAMVRKDGPHQSIPALLAYAKANPGKLNYGYYSSSSQVPPALLMSRTGVQMTGASYKNITQIITDIAGKVIDFAFLDALSAAPALQGGVLAPIAVTSAERFGNIPNVPAVAEAVPGFEVQSWLGLAAPAGTPRAILERMNAYARDAVQDPSIKTALERQGMIPQSASLADHRAFVQADRQRWAEWVRIAKIPAQ